MKNYFTCALHIRYPEFRLDVDLGLDEGELMTLLGPSGCGKTTFLRTVAGLEEPAGQKIYLGNKDIAVLPSHQRDIGFVFQDYALFPNMSVYDNIAYGPRMKGWDRKKIDEAVRRNLELVQLEGFEKRNPSELSGGEKQRVALARALAPEPGLLLLDEPLSALDKNSRERLRKQIRMIQKSVGLTTIYVTHDQEEAFGISDKIAVMNDGKTVQFGKPRDIYFRPETLFSARFTGNCNIIPSPDKSAAPLFFRSGSCRLTKPKDKNWTHFSGSIVYSEYQGDHYLAEMREKVSDEIIQFRLPVDREPHTGQELTIYVSNNDLVPLTDQSQENLESSDNGPQKSPENIDP